MDTMEQEGRGKFVLRCLLVLAACFLLGSGYASWHIAKECGFHETLGYGVELAGCHIYFPFAIFLWGTDPGLSLAIPDIQEILRRNKFPVLISLCLGGGLCYLMSKSMSQLTSHGTARFAKKEDIMAAGLDAKGNGVVVGTNPFTREIMLHDGPEHVFLAAPTRSGKGVGIIIPTAITWHYSSFWFDPKQELWIHTAGYRKRVLRQKVIKFEPLCSDGSGARWNPYAEIDFRGLKEIDDTRTINQTIVKTDEAANKDPFWDDSAIGLLNGVTIHLLYKHFREGKPLPCPSDTISFLASPTMDKPHLFTSMKIYPHISREEFMEEEMRDKDGNPILDADGKPCHYRNPLKEIYGEYIPDLKPFKEYLELAPGTAEWDAVQTLEDLRRCILEKEAMTKEEAVNGKMQLTWEPPPIRDCPDKKAIDEKLASAGEIAPLYQLLVHPKVAEEAAKILGNAEQTGASIISSAQTPLNLYQDPLIKRNTCVSDFCFRDLLDPEQGVSLYLVIQPNDVPKLRPLTRLFVNTMLAKTVRDMKFDVPSEKKQRLLMMLDEFPQLKKLDSIENTLAICAGYGIKICTVVQSITQLNQIYTKDNSILDNSQVQIYMTPSNLAAAKELSEILGDKTQESVSKSNNGKMFSTSSSTSEQGRRLMYPDELLRMKKDTELVIAQGCRPILCKKIRWFKEKFFRERVRDEKNKRGIPAPPYSDTCTEVKSYEQLFSVNAADVADMEKRQKAVTEAREAGAKKQGARKKGAKIPTLEELAMEGMQENPMQEESPVSMQEPSKEEPPHAETKEKQAEYPETPGPSPAKASHTEGTARASQGARAEDTEAVAIEQKTVPLEKENPLEGMQALTLHPSKTTESAASPESRPQGGKNVTEVQKQQSPPAEGPEEEEAVGAGLDETPEDEDVTEEERDALKVFHSNFRKNHQKGGETHGSEG